MTPISLKHWLQMQIIRVDTISTKPHNALADAMGIRDYFASK